MPRFLVSPRALGLHTVLVVFAVAFILLASWQWERAHSRVQDPLLIEAVALDELSEAGTAALPGSAVARSVVATGTFDGQTTYAVVEPQGSGSRPWVMTPLVTSDGSVIPVVHGTVESLASVTEVVVPSGQVQVEGRLQASQPAAPAGEGSAAAQVDPQAGVLASVTTSELAGLVDESIRPGFVVAASQVPKVTGVQELGADELIVPQGGLRVQNLLYTVQWTLFSAFVVFVYWRLLRDAWRDYSAEGRASIESRPPADPPASDGSTSTTVQKETTS